MEKITLKNILNEHIGQTISFKLLHSSIRTGTLTAIYDKTIVINTDKLSSCTKGGLFYINIDHLQYFEFL